MNGNFGLTLHATYAYISEDSVFRYEVFSDNTKRNDQVEVVLVYQDGLTGSALIEKLTPNLGVVNSPSFQKAVSLTAEPKFLSVDLALGYCTAHFRENHDKK